MATIVEQLRDALAAAAVQYAFEDNTFVEHGKHGWVVYQVRGPLNPWYLSGDGVWRYKHGNSFPTAESALLALMHANGKTLVGGASESQEASVSLVRRRRKEDRVNKELRLRLRSARSELRIPECACIHSGCWCYAPVDRKGKRCDECKAGWHINSDSVPFEEGRRVS